MAKLKDFYNKVSNDYRIYTAEDIGDMTRDEFLGIQNRKLYNPHITPDGYFQGIIVDYYDFVKRKGSDFPVTVNNIGYSMQEKGFLENLFNLYIIKEKLW